MTDQQLRKLSRKNLLKLLLEQEKARVALEEELQATKAELEKKRLCIENAGSLAEAALQLNGVFEAAQAAAQQYQDNVKEQCRIQEEELRKKVERTKRRVEEWVHITEEETLKKCKAMEQEARMAGSKEEFAGEKAPGAYRGE